MADWARKELNFDEEDRAILVKQKIDGGGLLTIQSIEKLEFYGFLGGPASKLWAAIEKLKKAQADSGMRLILIFFLNCGSILRLITRATEKEKRIAKPITW